MKAVAALLIILCLAAFVGVGYLYMTSTITVSFVDCVAVDPADQAEYFSALRRQVREETFVGTLFLPEVPENTEDCQFLAYTLRLENNSFLKADLLEFQIAPMAGDILQIGDTNAYSLSPHTGGEYTVTLLASRTSHSVREITVSYYLAGIPFFVRVNGGS